MSSIPVVFCFDKRIITGAAVSIKSLIDCAKENTRYDIRIFHSDLNLSSQKALSALVENTPHKIAFHYINPSVFKGMPCSKGSWSEIVYYRFLVPEILGEYKKAIYSDVDVLFKDDLSELYNTELNEFEFAAVRAEKNSENTIGHKYFPENKNEFIFWSGLMLFNCEKFRKDNILDKLIETAKIFNNKLKYYDLDLVNIVCSKILALPLKYCVLQGFIHYDDFKSAKEYEYLKEIYSDEDIKEALKNPIIIHYAGKLGKPWRHKKPALDYKKYLDEIPKNLKKYTLRDIRKKLTSKI